MSGRAAPIAAAVFAVVATATGGKAADLAPGERIARLEAAPLPPVSARPSPAHSLATLLQPAFRERWEESTRRERDRSYEAAAALRKALAVELRDDVHLHWRIARDTLRAAEQIPPSQTAERQALYQEALDWAKRGRALDPGCGECCLYEFAASARLLTPSGALPSPGSLRHVAKTLEACLERPPAWRDGPDESELGNLYYGAATFYRRLPRSRWFHWVAGVGGDRERAVALGRRALSLAPDRIDFHVELGASLLCLAAERDDPEARAEGIGWLERAALLPEQQPSDATDRERARAMLADPARACGDSRIGFSQGG